MGNVKSKSVAEKLYNRKLSENKYYDVFIKYLKFSDNDKKVNMNVVFAAAVTKPHILLRFFNSMDICEFDLNFQNSEGSTLLHITTDESLFLKYLDLNKHTYINTHVKDNNGFTALDIAISNNSYQIYNILQRFTKVEEEKEGIMITKRRMNEERRVREKLAIDKELEDKELLLKNELECVKRAEEKFNEDMRQIDKAGSDMIVHSNLHELYVIGCNQCDERAGYVEKVREQYRIGVREREDSIRNEIQRIIGEKQRYENFTIGFEQELKNH